MSNATYIAGTAEYVILEVECHTPGATFAPADWTAKAALVPIGEPFVDADADWEDAELATVGTVVYAKALLTDLLDPVTPGKYRALMRLTKTVGGTESPLLRAGLVIVEPG
jgi:hypothetical protein